MYSGIAFLIPHQITAFMFYQIVLDAFTFKKKIKIFSFNFVIILL